MLFDHEYPYTNFHEMNLDYLLKAVKAMEAQIKNFIGLNTIKYANPFTWSIDHQYEANTVVVDAETGNAFISTKAVPSGVSISDTNYWTQIFNYAREFEKLREEIAAADEGTSTTATADREVGSLVWLNTRLVEVIAEMNAGDAYVIGSNCKDITIEEYVLEHDNIQETIEALTTGEIAFEKIAYVEPSPMNDFFKTVPFKGENGDYNVLVANSNISKLSSVSYPIMSYPTGEYMFDGLTSTATIAQGFDIDENNYYVININSAATTQILRVINKVTGAESNHSFNNMGHANDITHDENRMYVATNGNTIAVFNKGSYGSNVIYTGDHELSAIAYDFVTGKYYGKKSKTIFLVEFDHTAHTFSTTEFFTIKEIIPDAYNQAIAANNGIVYCLFYRPNAVLMYNETGYLGCSNIFNATDTLFTLGELEGIQWFDGKLYLSSEVNTSSNTTDYPSNKVDQISYVDFTYNQVLNASAVAKSGRVLTLYVDEASTAKYPLGTEGSPYNQIYKAVSAAETLYAMYGIQCEIKVARGQYGHFDLRGSAVYMIRPIDSYYYVDSMFIQSATVRVIGPIFTNRKDLERCVYIECAKVYLSDYGFEYKERWTGNLILAAYGSDLTLLSARTSASAYGKVLFASSNIGNNSWIKCYSSIVNCYETLASWSMGGGVSVFTRAMPLAESISVTTSAKAVTFNKYAGSPTTITALHTAFREYILIKDGAAYSLRGAGTISVGGVNVTLAFTNNETGITLKGASAINIDALYVKC